MSRRNAAPLMRPRRAAVDPQRTVDQVPPNRQLSGADSTVIHTFGSLGRSSPITAVRVGPQTRLAKVCFRARRHCCGHQTDMPRCAVYTCTRTHRSHATPAPMRLQKHHGDLCRLFGASNATSHVHGAFEMPDGNTQPLLGSGISIKYALHRKIAYYICEREPHTAFQPTCQDRQQCVHRDFFGRNKSPDFPRDHTSVTAVANNFPSNN
jgi:hypothetical protein